MADKIVDNNVPTSHPWPAYFNVLEYEEVYNLYRKAWSHKYETMVRMGTLPALESELYEIIVAHISPIIFAKEKLWFQRVRPDVDMETHENELFQRICFKTEAEREAFLRRFPKWSKEPNVWVWEAERGVEPTYDTRLSVKTPNVVPTDGQHSSKKTMGERLKEPLPQVRRETFEIKTGKPLK